MNRWFTLVLCSIVLSGMPSPAAQAGSLLDDFSTSPYDVPARWCERFHHVHWEDDPSSTTYQSMKAVNGTCCAGVGACGTCVTVIGQAGSCGGTCPSTDFSVANACQGLAVTTADYVGDDRVVSMTFGLMRDLSEAALACGENENVKVVAAAHPNCDATVEAQVIRQAGGPPEYALQIRSLTTPRAGYAECELTDPMLNEINRDEMSTIDAVAQFDLVVGDMNRYEVSLLVTPTLGASTLDAVAEVVDRDTGAVLATASLPGFFRPAWYDIQGRRFAIGSVFSAQGERPVLDDFEGEAVLLPPNPMEPGVASPINPQTPTTVSDSTAFLYTPSSPGAPTVQTSFDDATQPIAPGTIEEDRAAVIRGRVLDSGGSSLGGVSITVLGHEEFGRTHSRLADGGFDLAVNGGGALTVVYERQGYLTSHRTVNVPWQDYTTAPDVVLVEVDTVATPITLSEIPTDEIVVHRGSEVLDHDSPTEPRQATLLFFEGTTATMTLPDGTQQSLDDITVRATEYTVGDVGSGDFGLERMPAPLPPNTAYTYAVELSIDEADAAGATRVDFLNNPVVFYIENFLDIPADDGQGNQVTVPVGYYDREAALWVPSENGHIIDILGFTGGAADIDPLVVSNLGISPEELEKLAALYDTGAGPPYPSLWRVEVPHFSPWDYNFPYGPPVGSGPCGCDEPTNEGEEPPDRPDCQVGSAIGCQTQTLSESVEIVGTPYRLSYHSDRVRGREASRTLRIPLTGSPGPSIQNLKRIEVEVQVAGQYHSDHVAIDPVTPEFPTAPYPFTWDGTDAYGRTVQGRVPVTIRLGYTYELAYGRVDAFGDYPLNIITGSRARRELTFWETSFAWVENWDARSAGLGGWGLSDHHTYDVGSGVLLMGDGGRRSATSTAKIAGSVAGGGAFEDVPDGTPGLEAALNGPNGVAVAASGSVFFSELNRVRRVDSDGSIHRVAGRFSTSQTFLGDDPLVATVAILSQPTGIAVGNDGTVYVADRGHHRIRRIYESGGQTLLDTLAGATDCPGLCPFNGSFGGDGGPAADAFLNQPTDLSIGPDGAVYFVDWANRRIRRIGTDGFISTVAGTGSGASSPDGTLAVMATLNRPESIHFDADGRLVFVENGSDEARVRRIRTDGTLETIAGVAGLDRVNPPEGSIAAAVGLFEPSHVRVAPDGSLLIVDRTVNLNSSQRIVRRVSKEGVIRTFAGMGDSGGFGGDGGPARLATFNGIRGIAVGPDKTVYLSDGGLNVDDRIRRVSDDLSDSTDGSEVFVGSTDGSEIYVFDLAGRHQRTLDAWTHTPILQFVYYPEPDGRLQKIVDRSGNETTFAYPTADTGTITAPDGQETQFTLDATDGYLASIINPASEGYTFGYTDDLLTSMVDPRGSAYEFAYDAGGLGRLERDADPEVLAQLGMGASFKTLSRSDITDEKYLVDLRTTLDRSTKYEVEELPDGSLKRTTTDPGLVVRTFSVGADDRRFGATESGLEFDIELGPDPRLGMAAPLVARADLLTPAEVTQQGSGVHAVVEETRTALPADPTQPLQTYVRTVSVNQRDFRRSFDSVTGTITDETPEATQGRRGYQRTYLDAEGRVSEVEVQGLYPVTFNYGVGGRLESIRHGVAGGGAPERVYQFGYDDPNGAPLRLTSVVDPYLDALALEIGLGPYDGAERLAQVTLPDSTTVGFAYNENGDVTDVTPPGRPVHTFTYDLVGQGELYTPPQASPPLGNVQTSVDYNLDRQVESVTRPDGGIIDFVYGAPSGRLESVTLPPGDGSLSIGYDAHGLVASVSGPEEGPGRPVVAFEYDGPLPLRTVWGCSALPCPVGVTERVVGQQYDQNFRRRSQNIDGANEVLFEYDEDDLLTDAGALGITRDIDPTHGHGFVLGTDIGEVVDAYSYSGFGEVLTYSVAYSGSSTYALNFVDRDALGRIITKTESVDGGTPDTYEYTYDERGRLDTVSKNGSLLSDYSYDPNGNRLSGVEQYDQQDRLCVKGTTVYDYTAAGELSAKTENATDLSGCGTPSGDTTHYTYDALGNLRNVVLPNGVQIEYVVDGLGRRVAKKVDGLVTKAFLYEDELRIVAELNPDGTILSRFVYGEKPNVPEYMVRGGVTYRLVTDHLGSVRLVIDTRPSIAEPIVQRIDYDEFGRIDSVHGNEALGFHPFGFAGGLYDDDTKLTRFGARDYDADTGRWTAKDPIRFSGGTLNLYAYASGDPVNLADPTGKVHVGVIIGGVIGAASGILGVLGDGGACGQRPSLGDLANAAAAGALTGGLLGLLDPTGASLVLPAAAGVLGSLAGQAAAIQQSGGSISDVNLGSAVGSGLGAALGFPLTSAARGLAANFGASPLLSEVLPGLASLSPATLGGLLGGAIGGDGGDLSQCQCRHGS